MLYITLLFSGVYLIFAHLYSKYALAKPKNASKFKGLNVGHRGCRRFRNLPENTLKAFDFAIQQGADAIELDCRLTKDKRVVVVHDDNLSRLAKNNGWVDQMTWEQLRSVPILPAPVVLSQAPDTYKPSRSISTLKSNPDCVCLLEDVLNLAKSARPGQPPVKVFVEIKSTTFNWKEADELAKAVAKVIRACNASDFACVISFSPLVLYYLRVAAPEVECCMLYSDDFFESTVRNKVERYSWWLPYLYKPLDGVLRHLCQYHLPEFLGCTMVGPDVSLLSVSEMKAFRRRGLEIYAWVVNTPEEAAWCFRHGISYGTDAIFPELLLSTSGNRHSALTQRMADTTSEAMALVKLAADSLSHDYEGSVAKARADSEHLGAGLPPPFHFVSSRVSDETPPNTHAAVAMATAAAAAVVSSTSAVAMATAAATVASAAVAAVQDSVHARVLEDSEPEENDMIRPAAVAGLVAQE